MVGLDILRLAGSMVLILILLGAMYWILRKLKEKQMLLGKSGRLTILETLNLGSRQKIALLQVDGQRILIGITAQQINNLAHWKDETSELESHREA